jgi:transposase-like protein
MYDVAILLAPVAGSMRAMTEPAVPVPGKDYPATWSQFLTLFPNDSACARYLEGLRWPDGFACPACGVLGEPYRATRARLMCTSCDHQASVTAGTIFDKTRTPLTVWFAAAWHITSQKYGTSALGLQRVLGLGSYQTAWTMLHRFRRAMVRSNRERLRGEVEADEVWVALGDRDDSVARKGLKKNKKTTKVPLLVAAEVVSPKGIGRIRLRRVPSATQEHVEPFIRENVEPPALLRTDGSALYFNLESEGYRHHRTVVHDVVKGKIGELPAVNLVTSLLKRWLLGTHQGAVQPQQLDHYLEEFTFRFNRRRSRSRGLLFYRLIAQACEVGPVTYRDIIAHEAVA